MPFFGGSSEYKISGTNIIGGHDTLPINVGTDNIGVGNSVLANNVTGMRNIGIGNNALDGSTTGSGNIGVGYNALSGSVLNNSLGQSSIAIGQNALSNNNAFGAIAIGSEAGAYGNPIYPGDISNSTLIGNGAGAGFADIAFTAAINGLNEPVFLDYPGINVRSSTSVFVNSNVRVNDTITNHVVHNSVFINQNVYFNARDIDFSNSVVIGTNNINNGRVAYSVDGLIAIGCDISFENFDYLSDSVLIGNKATPPKNALTIQIGNPNLSYQSIQLGDLDLTHIGRSVVTIDAGAGISVDDTDPENPIVKNTGVISVTAGSNITVNDSDPQNIIISATGGGQVDEVKAGAGISVDDTDPENPIVKNTGVISVTAGSNITVNDSDPQNIVISATGGGGGGGQVDEVKAGAGISVDDTDPENPIVKNTGVISVTAGSNITVNDSDPQNIIISATGGGGGGGAENPITWNETIGNVTSEMELGVSNDGDNGTFYLNTNTSGLYNSASINMTNSVDDPSGGTYCTLSLNAENAYFSEYASADVSGSENSAMELGTSILFAAINATNDNSSQSLTLSTAFDVNMVGSPVFLNTDYVEEMEISLIPQSYNAAAPTFGAHAPKSGMQARAWLKVVLSGRGDSADYYLPLFN